MIPHTLKNAGITQSCSMGVTQRLLTATKGLSVADNPDARPIGVNYLVQRFKEQLITHEERGMLPKLRAFSDVALENFKAHLDALIFEGDASVHKALSDSLSLTTQDIAAFTEDAKKYYGEIRFLALADLSYQGQCYKTAETLIKALASNPGYTFSQESYQFVNQMLAALKLKDGEKPTDIVEAAMTVSSVLSFNQTSSSSSSSNAPRRSPERAYGKREQEEASNDAEHASPKKRRKRD